MTGWLPAQQHAGENIGNTETHVLFVELKQDGATGAPGELAEVRKALPNARLVYAADRAGYPYGTRPPAVSR